MAAIGGHQRAYRGRSDEWLTPPEIIEATGPYHLDPCAPVERPWDMAERHFTVNEDGLQQPWEGRVWLNPPYGPETGKWLHRLASHPDGGMALIFARTETEMFHRHAWERANAMLFLEGRLHFYDVTGNRAKHNAGGPSVLIAYGRRNVSSLRVCGLKGMLIELK